jgi:NAD(P)-dependent dehydrogenase (short-subunit alcohol dehydrogenase family)
MTHEQTHAGRRALVTGAGQGVGRAIALALAAAGAEVLVNDLARERADAVVAEAAAAGGTASSAVFDVTDWPAVQRWAAQAGPVDILVNNAGNAGRVASLTRTDFGLFADSDPAQWEVFLRVNLYGVMHVTRAALPAMMSGGYGRVVTVVSDAGRVGEPTMAAYAAAKAGAAGFMRSVAREVGDRGITANCVSLGTIDTTVDGPSERAAPDRRALGRYVIRRAGRPADVAPLVTFLTGPDAEWITGQTYPVNGGYSFTL